MGKLSKKVGRKKQVQAKKDAQESLNQQVAMFGLLPDNCSICNADFDKSNREMAMTWRVVTNEQEERVTPICPDCHQKIDEDIQKVFGEDND